MIEVIALRRSWAQPGEFLCWVVDAEGRYLFEVSGRDATGAPKKGFAARLAGGLGALLWKCSMRRPVAASRTAENLRRAW